MKLRYSLLILSAVFALVQCGCQGLQGVRYHDNDVCESCDVADVGYAEDGLPQMLAEPMAEPSVLPPHSRFHPVPTRPVFEPQQATLLAPARADVNALQLGGNAGAAEQARSTVDDSPRSSVRLASANTGQSVLSPRAEEDEAAAHSSRRKPTVMVEADVEELGIIDAPPTPADSPPTNSTDMWRPRVGDN